MTGAAANYVSASRFAFSIALVVLIYIDTHTARVGALIAVCLSGLSDFVDGQVARHRQPTIGGAVLDPMADTFALLTGFTCLLYRGVIPLWFFALALWSRVIFSLVRMLSLAMGRRYAAPQLTTKVKAAGFAVGQVILFAGYAFGDDISWLDASGVRGAAIAFMTVLLAVAVVDFVFVTHRRLLAELFALRTPPDN